MIGDLHLSPELSHLPPPRAVKAAGPSSERVQEKREVGARPGRAVSHAAFPQAFFSPISLKAH